VAKVAIARQLAVRMYWLLRQASDATSPVRMPSSPELICPRVLSPPTPEGPVAAFAHCFTTGVRPHHTAKTGHFPFALTGPYRVHLRCGSRVRLPGLRQQDYSSPRLFGYLSNEQLQGKLLSAYKISHACPGARGLRDLLCCGPRLLYCETSGGKLILTMTIP